MPMFSGHYAYKNTLRRIRLSFCFPQMNQQIKEYCDTCHDCQLRARELIKDGTNARGPLSIFKDNWSDDGRERPVAFAGCKLTAGRRAWAAIGAEACAAVWSLRGCRRFVFGSGIACCCDHNPLLYITEGVTSSAKLLRWSLALQQFDVSFKYRPGRQNIVADCLSRLWIKATTATPVSYTHLTLPTILRV